METQDEFDKLISEARDKMPIEAKRAIDSFDLASALSKLSDRYTPDQIDDLEIETTLLLCGLLNPENYGAELESKMKIGQSNVQILIGELNRLVFEKIKEQLINNINKPDQETPKPAEKKDQVTEVVAKNFEEVVDQSNWKNKLYEISQKYELPVDKKVLLEQLTSKMILGSLHPNEYQKEIETKIVTKNGSSGDLIKDINEKILLSIREGLRKSLTTPNEEDDDLPIPPYRVVEEKPKSSNEIYEKAGINIIKDSSDQNPQEVKETLINENTDNGVLENSGINIIGEKLTNQTINTNVVKDYSLPKINKISQDQIKGSGDDGHLKHHDPYKEEI